MLTDVISKTLSEDGKEIIELNKEDVAIITDSNFFHKLRITLEPEEIQSIPGHKLMMMVVYYLLLYNPSFHEYLRQYYEDNKEEILEFFNMEPVNKH